MQLTMVPNLGISPTAAQEYIFLIDRSGSMNGNKIETAKNAFVMLLRAQPGHDIQHMELRLRTQLLVR